MPDHGKFGNISESKFVGRKKEFEETKRHLEESIQGNGRLVFVVGEAGIGKSRLVSELSDYAGSKDVMFLRGRCLYEENTEPYLPFIDAFGKYISDKKLANESEIRKESEASEDFFSMGLVGIAGGSASEDFPGQTSGSVVDMVSMGLLPIGDESGMAQPPKIEKIDIHQERTRLFESLSQLVINISETQPLLLVLDDLQWADDGSLQLLHYLARNIQRSRVMICGSYRPEELETISGEVHPLSKTMRRMRPEKLFYEIKLKRFDKKSTAAIIKSLLKRDDIPEPFIKRLYEESEGNPFFIEEVVKSLINEGLIDMTDYTWDAKLDLSRIHIPGSIRDVIGRRMDRLNDGTKNILRYASGIGNTFTFDTLHKVSGVDEEKLIDSIDALIAGNIIHEDTTSRDERYRFDHTQIREVIYNSMSRSRRRLMHKRIGCMLEELNKHRIEDVVYNLAHHYYEGRSDEKTLTYAVMAGEKATKAFAPEDALSYYNMGLSALERIEKSKENKEKKIELLKRLGEISFNLSEWRSALDYYKNSIDLCEDVKDDKCRAESLRKIGYVFNRMGNWKFASMKFESALKISKKLDDKHGIADAHRGLGYIHWRMGQYEDAIEHYNQCIQFSMWVGDMHTIALTFIELGNVYTETGDSDKAIEYYYKALKELEPIHDYSEMARAYNNLGDTHLKSESYEMAIAYFEKCEVMGRRIGRKDIVGWSLFNRGEAWALKGDADKALDCAERSLNILNIVGDKLGMQACYKIFGMAYGMKKEWDKAIEHFDTFVKMGNENQVPYIQAEGHYYFGKMYKAKGDKKNAKEQLKKALEIFKSLNAQEFVSRVEKQLKGL